MKNSAKVWTPEKKETLSRLYSTTDTSVLAAQFGCSIDAVNKQASLLKVLKSPEQRKTQTTAAALARKRETPVKKAKKVVTPKRTKQPKPEPKQVLKGYHYPMGSPEYKAWEASLLVGRTRTAILDANGKVAHVYRKNS